MVIIFLRTAIIFILLIIVMRLMGKRQIGEMQPYEFIITMLIAEIACVPMSDVSIPLLYGISSIVAIFILHQCLSFLEQSGQIWKRIVSGKPSIVIDKNGVNIGELKKNNLGVEDLMESLRSTGNFSLNNVKYAILESNGKLSVVTTEDEVPPSLPILIIDSGKILENNLAQINCTKETLTKFLNKNGAKNIKFVDVMTVDGSGIVYLQLKGQKFTMKKISISTNASW